MRRPRRSPLGGGHGRRDGGPYGERSGGSRVCVKPRRNIHREDGTPRRIEGADGLRVGALEGPQRAQAKHRIDYPGRPPREGAVDDPGRLVCGASLEDLEGDARLPGEGRLTAGIARPRGRRERQHARPPAPGGEESRRPVAVAPVVSGPCEDEHLVSRQRLGPNQCGHRLAGVLHEHEGGHA